MKIQCDVCQKADASVFCCADEAALCLKCDSNVHDANKLASKHPRVSLLDPQQNFPRCDICQEKRAFFFCREDRALLCRDCDFSVHSSNGLTAKHGRFFVSGIKVSLDAVETPSPSLSTSLVGASGSASLNNKNEMEVNKGIEMEKAATATATAGSVVNKRPRANPLTDLPVFLPKQSENAADDISQYLNQVEEFLASSSPSRLDWFAIGDSSKGEDIGKAFAADWAADLGFPVEALYGDSLAEVPHTPSPSISMDLGICSYSGLGIVMKQKPRHHHHQYHQQQQSHLFHFNTLNTADDVFLVPDVGAILPNKRIRHF